VSSVLLAPCQKLIEPPFEGVNRGVALGPDLNPFFGFIQHAVAMQSIIIKPFSIDIAVFIAVFFRREKT
jgi:hypothetical protein